MTARGTRRSAWDRSRRGARRRASIRRPTWSYSGRRAISFERVHAVPSIVSATSCTFGLVALAVGCCPVSSYGPHPPRCSLSWTSTASGLLAYRSTDPRQTSPQGDTTAFYMWWGLRRVSEPPTLRSMPLPKRGAVNDAARIDHLTGRGGPARTERQGRLWSALTVRYHDLPSGIALGRCPLVFGTRSSVAVTASSVDTWPPPLPVP
jgi:hypothetical protein